jgi:beta-N-acetylhexosaminidase
LRALHGRDDLPILIDQEGGRVARLGPPHWPAFPSPGAPFGRLYELAPMSAMEAARANAEALALTLTDVGINVNCLPLLDVRQPGAADIIGDRAFGSDPMHVAVLGPRGARWAGAGRMRGRGQAHAGTRSCDGDSHKELPVVHASDEELASDLEPFVSLNDAPMGMTAHVVYTAWDAERPGDAVAARHWRNYPHAHRVRRVSDERRHRHEGAVRNAGREACGAVAAGCDVALDCWARMDEMVEIAGRVGALSERGGGGWRRRWPVPSPLTRPG